MHRCAASIAAACCESSGVAAIPRSSRIMPSNARCTSTRTEWCRRCFRNRSFRPEPPLEWKGRTMARPIVYGPAGSSHVWSARLALAEKGVTHELVDVRFGAHREQPHLSRQPFAKVPGFEHDGFALYET